MMKSFVGFLFIITIFSCTSADKKETSENDVDAARNFIRAALDGNYSKARQFMLRDSSNEERLDNVERSYQQNPDKEDKRNYRESSITIYDSRKLNDSVTVINYSNSYMKKKDSLKAVRINGEWLIDLKYSFLPTNSAKNVQ